MRFEEGMVLLEKLVASLESGDLPLEEALGLFEQGVGLVRSLQEKLNEAELEPVEDFGCAVIDVPGATVSTVQLRSAGVGSWSPPESVARTRNVWESWERPV